MKVSCPSCGTNYNIDDKRIPPGGAKLKCAKCQATFPIKPDGAPASAGGAVPLPGQAAPTSPGIPLPGTGSRPTGSSIPLPGPGDGRSGSGPAIPLPGAGGSPSGPLGFSSAAATFPGIPLPGSGSRVSAAVPLPGSMAAAVAVTSPAIPLPGTATTAVHDVPFDDSATQGGIPLPGPGDMPVSSPSPWAEESTRVMSIPMPPEAMRPAPAPSAPAIPLPGSGGAPFSFGSGSEALPLPGKASPAPAADDLDFADADLVESAPVPVPAPAGPGLGPGLSISAAVPLPPSRMDPEESTQVASDASAAGPFDFADLPPPPPPAPVAPPTDLGIDFGDPPPPPPAPADPPGMDFSDLPSPAGAQMPLPAGSAFDFSGPDDATRTAAFPPPPPGEAPAAAMDFSDLPSPKPKDDLLDFGELPSPAAGPPAPAAPPPQPAGGGEGGAPGNVDFSFDFAEPPPPPPPPAAPLPPEPEPAAAAPSSGFGEVDFGEPPPPPPPAPSASISDPLEFDPTSKVSPAAPRDELEADLSAPIPPPSSSGPADGLEMLSFIDDAAKEGGGRPGQKKDVKRYHVRRRSGKTFGPFDEGVVLKMLEDGQLQGNEDISLDGESWAGMGSVPTFSAAIQKLMDSPARLQAPAAGADGAQQRPSGPQPASVDRLKQLYEGRMAAVAVVDRRREGEKLKRLLPLYIAGGALALLALAGASLGFTRYGPFAMKLLFPATLSPASPQHADHQNAKKAILSDTFKSYQEARDLTGKILAASEYPEVRATWCQAVFYLQRRYAAATPQEKQDAEAALPRIQLLGMKNAEVVKAMAGSALARRDPDAALPILLEAKAREANEDDRELDMLLAESYAQKGDAKAAEEVLKRVLNLDKGSAKALHALGNLHQAASRADEAAKAYAAALEADPQHVASAVELAALEILVKRNSAEGKRAVERALSAENQALLGPAELSRAKALRGVVLAEEFKPKEATAELDEALKLDPDSVFSKAMLARVLLDQRDHKRALPLFREVSTRVPSNIDYAEGYLQALVSNGNMSDALNQVTQVNARFPGDARIAFLYGRISDALDNAAEAEGHFKRAIAADPKLYKANLALARFYLRFRRVADAKPQLEQAVQKAPQDAAVRSGMGELAYAEGDLAEARREFEQSARLDPTLADAHLGLAKVSFAELNFQRSLEEADRALALDPLIKDGRLQRALALWKLGRPDESIQELDKARAEDPKSARVLITAGAVRLEKNDLPQAESALLSALALEPSNHEAHFYMARMKARRFEFTQAIESMKSALEHAPKRAAYHYEMGLIYRDAKKLNDAIEAWNSTVKLDPQHADALEALGQAYLDRGELERAVESFDKSMKADPSRTRILGLVGDCFFQATRWNDAIARYLQALKVDPSLVQIYYKLGRAHSEKGDELKAIAYFQRATQVDRENPMPYYYLGYAYKTRNRKREAVAAFRDYLKRKPDAEDKKEIEDEIYDLEQNYQ
jgi:predicted Zn finger-like uncharacterized protein